jgi:transcriptional regulator with XRE-family HTH domain
VKIDKLLLDESILAELGFRLAQRRLELEFSQAEIAKQSGVSKRAVERMEAGTSTQLTNMIRILRVLDLMDRLETLVPEVGPRPMDLLKLKGKARKRASRNKVRSKEPWQWGDES